MIPILGTDECKASSSWDDSDDEYFQGISSSDFDDRLIDYDPLNKKLDIKEIADICEDIFMELKDLHLCRDVDIADYSRNEVHISSNKFIPIAVKIVSIVAKVYNEITISTDTQDGLVLSTEKDPSQMFSEGSFGNQDEFNKKTDQKSTTDMNSNHSSLDGCNSSGIDNVEINTKPSERQELSKGLMGQILSKMMGKTNRVSESEGFKVIYTELVDPLVRNIILLTTEAYTRVLNSNQSRIIVSQCQDKIERLNKCPELAWQILSPLLNLQGLSESRPKACTIESDAFIALTLIWDAFNKKEIEIIEF